MADEETAYSMVTDVKVEEVKINGIDAAIVGSRNIYWESNDVLYSLHGMGEVGESELINIAESIK